MARDAKSAERLLSVQQQLRKIEEAKLAELQRQLQEVKSDQVAIVAAMNDDGALQNLYLDTMARRLTSLAEREGRLEKLIVVQSVAVRAEAAKEKAAEKLAQERRRHEQAKAEQAQLNEILELLAHPRGDASLP